MTQSTRPYRSVLYIPGANARALDKARSLAADAIIFDLEDAVAPDAKDEARATLRAALDEGGYGNRARLVRVNGFDSPWYDPDLAAFHDAPCDGILLPKVNTAQDIETIAQRTEKPIWAMMETAQGVLNAAEIAAHPRLAGIVMGTNDLVKELAAQPGPDRAEIMTALQHSLLAARSAGVVIVDGVYNAFKDEQGLEVECAQGRRLGFDGKTLIHPAQLATANAAFSPTPDELDLARRQIAAFKDAAAQGKGVAVVDGKIVENLHIVTAEALLAKAEAIANLEG